MSNVDLYTINDTELGKKLIRLLEGKGVLISEDVDNDYIFFDWWDIIDETMLTIKYIFDGLSGHGANDGWG